MLGRMLNVHYIPSSRLSNLLKHWAGTDLQETKAKVPEDQIRKKIRVLFQHIFLLHPSILTLAGDVNQSSSHLIRCTAQSYKCLVGEEVVEEQDFAP